MPMECSFKIGVLKLKIHMTNLVLPERSSLRKCQQRKKLISGAIASFDMFEKQYCVCRVLDILGVSDSR